MKLAKIIKHCRIDKPEKFKLADFDPAEAFGLPSRAGVIKHMMAGVNPQGCAVHAFKAPSVEELAHNFLWRIDKYLPERGRIGIFNRSHY
jgi:polyphosphate kinase 2 (PPK2 family)